MDCSEHLASPRPRLLAYAALVCGGVVACLMLLAGPAQADGPEAPARGGDESVLGLAKVGDRVAATTRDVGATATDAVKDVGARATDTVRRAAAPVRQAAPVVDQVTRQVDAGTGAVADAAQDAVGVVTDVTDRAAQQVDQQVDEQVDGEGPTRPRHEADAPAGRAVELTVDQRPRHAADRDVRRADRTARASADRLIGDPAPATPASTASTVDPTVSPAATSAQPEPSDGPVRLSLLSGCDPCGATSGGSSGDTLHVLGLPSAGITTPRLADPSPPDAAEGGPSANFQRPDVSPD